MTTIMLGLITLIFLDVIFLAVLGLLVVPIGMYKSATFAVLKRNFIGYFSNPTGYAFLCLFVLLTSFAAFWPHEFFNSNMATLDQLNQFLPYIMLVFIPAITMSIWAEERRQGTDELLLTIPADDLDIVLGKYLAAASIFTASLLFSQLATFSVLIGLALGGVDVGLFFTTYCGYWLLGLAMLSIGMVASFLTNNLTVGFILGSLFNAPLVFAANADVIVPGTNAAQAVRAWSISAQFEDFGRGVVSLSSVIYFAMIMMVGLYLSMVLIGRRHWSGGRDGSSILPHYVVRALALIILAAAATKLFTDFDVRKDATSEQISSLSNSTYRLIDNLELNRPVYVEAYISKSLPEAYIKTKYDILSLLSELKANGGGMIRVNIHDNMETSSEAAQMAEERHGIRPATVQTVAHGSFAQERIYLSAVFSCGLERVVIPFFGHANSVEYEIVRSIATVAQAGAGESTVATQRKRIGILKTDADLAGSAANDFMAMMRGGRIPPQAIVTELDKQYELDRDDDGNIEYVDANSRLPGGFAFRSENTFAQQLDQSEIPEALRTQFEENGASLSEDAVVAVVTQGSEWKIADRENKYTASVDNNRLNVFEDRQHDVLLVVQPSSLTQPQLSNLMDAIRRGQPTVLFEDPLPVEYFPRTAPSTAYVPGTDMPKPPHPGMQMGMNMPQDPKGDIRQLWNMLGVKLTRAKRGVLEATRVFASRPSVSWTPFTAVVWQGYNPYPKVDQFGDFVVFANPDAAGPDDPWVFNSDDEAVADLDEVAFITPGAIEERSTKLGEAKDLEVIPLVRLVGETGILDYDQRALTGQVLLKEVLYESEDQPETQDVDAAMEDVKPAEQGRSSTLKPYVVAARIRTMSEEDEQDEEQEDDQDQPGDGDCLAADEDAPPKPKIDVVLVSDIDVLGTTLVTFRNQPNDIGFKFQNGAFVLNLLDSVADDDRFLEIRGRQADHASLKLIENRIRQARTNMQNAYEEYEDTANEQRREATEQRIQLVSRLQRELDEAQASAGAADTRAVREAREKLRDQEEINKREEEEQRDELERNLTKRLEEEERNLDLDKQRIQNQYKFWAVVLPPIPPLIVGLVVFVLRRLREREGVAKERLR